MSPIVIIVKTTQGGTDMLSEEMLKQAAEELAFALIESLSEPEQCQHPFSDSFEKRSNPFYLFQLILIQMVKRRNFRFLTWQPIVAI